jgi:uncharacterized membrane protein
MNSMRIAVITPNIMIVFMGTTLQCLGLAAGAYLRWGQANGKLVLAAALLYFAIQLA